MGISLYLNRHGRAMGGHKLHQHGLRLLQLLDCIGHIFQSYIELSSTVHHTHHALQNLGNNVNIDIDSIQSYSSMNNRWQCVVVQHTFNLHLVSKYEKCRMSKYEDRPGTGFAKVVLCHKQYSEHQNRLILHISSNTPRDAIAMKHLGICIQYLQVKHVKFGSHLACVLLLGRLCS